MCSVHPNGFLRLLGHNGGVPGHLYCTAQAIRSNSSWKPLSYDSILQTSAQRQKRCPGTWPVTGFDYTAAGRNHLSQREALWNDTWCLTWCRLRTEHVLLVSGVCLLLSQTTSYSHNSTSTMLISLRLQHSRPGSLISRFIGTLTPFYIKLGTLFHAQEAVVHTEFDAVTHLKCL